MKRFFVLGYFVCCVFSISAQTSTSQKKILPPYLSVKAKWVDSVLNSMSLDEKIGQLFMVPCWSKKSDSEMVRLPDLINNYHIGGIIFMQGGPMRQAQLTNYFQSISKVSLLISQDAEWGLGMRLDSMMNFPREL